MDEEKTYRLNAVALLAQRNTDGSVAKDSAGKAQLIGKQAALQLMRGCVQVNAGQGSFTLLVPKDGVEAIGLGPVWEKVKDTFPLTERDGKQYYHVADYMQSVALMDVLELQAEQRWNNAVQAPDRKR